MSSLRVNLEQYLIPLEEILLATRNFSSETKIGGGGAGEVFGGQLSERWQYRRAAFHRLYPKESFGQPEFLDTVEFMPSINHEKIIPFIGYCDEEDTMIIVTEYANNQSLREQIMNPDNRRSLTWAQRLKICLGAAAGLEYLHSGLGEGRSVIHRNIKSTKILLDENLEAKIHGFNESVLVDLNQPPVESVESVTTDIKGTKFHFDITRGQFYIDIAGSPFYMDPLYEESRMVNTELDVYSFGVVLFEVLTGIFAFNRRSVGDNPKQSLINLVRRYYDDGLDNLIDPFIREDINIRSFGVFKKIAYQCISLNLEDRPTMNTIVKRIQEALDIQNHEAASNIAVPSHQHQSLGSFLIPMEEIFLATQNFSEVVVGSPNVYKGQLSEKWQNRTAAFKCFDNKKDQGKEEFRNELKMVSSFHHKNVIGFIGYCDEYNLIIVYDYAINGNLYQHLYEPEIFSESHCLTWPQRLQICVGAARGLEYLHSCLGEDIGIIHRDIWLPNILLADNLEAKISNFSLSLIVNRNRPQVYDVPARSSYCSDPVYKESGIVNTKLDIFSFGMVMILMLRGTPAMTEEQEQSSSTSTTPTYSFFVRPTNIHSFRVFTKTANQCTSLKLDDRPTMKRIIKRIEEAQDFQKHEDASVITTHIDQHQNLEKFRISLEEINLAIKDFNQQTPIGDGGYGKVYKAKLSQHWQNSIVAIKCLDPEGHQGKKEFLNEVKLISNFHHRNIISFVGYCDEGDQMIIVSKYAVNGSLDHHLQNPSKRNRLTWAQRLKICLGAAKGLDYLHSGLGKNKRIIHRDIKSGNILLDENMEAKICDFGLSKQGPGNQQDTKVYTKVAGTYFYLDPLYRETDKLSRESDVYSFGVVLFEILRGMMAYQYIRSEDGDPQHLISLVRRYYKDEPQKLIDPVIRDEIDNDCFHMFKELAYRCISLNSEERPTMDTIIDKIEDAIDLQEHVM